MLKDDKSLVTDPTVASIQAAGAAAVNGPSRLFSATATVGDVTMAMPYVVDGTGAVRQLSELQSAVQAEHQKRHPDRTGRYQMSDLTSLLAWAQRHTTDDTAAYVKAPEGRNAGSATVVVDDLPRLGPDGGRRVLRAVLPLELHDRLLAWIELDSIEMDVEKFSDHVNRAIDELSGTDLVTMIANVEVSTSSSWTRTVDADNRVRLVAEESKGTSKVPARFSFMTPVFDDDDPANVQMFTCRLVCKVQNKKPVFSYEILDLKNKLGQAVKRIRDDLGQVVAAVYMGNPPTP